MRRLGRRIGGGRRRIDFPDLEAGAGGEEGPGVGGGG